MKKMITAQSGHQLYVASTDRDNVPEFKHKESYRKFYIVRNFDENGHIFMYIGKGHPHAPNQYVVWYAQKGSFWDGYGTTIEEAINGAQKDGWMYA